MTEYRTPTTTKVVALIAAHADLLGQHGISGGLHASRPATGEVNEFYFSTDTKVWSRGNGTGWDENTNGFTEAQIQALIDASISIHAGIPDAHHAKYTDAEAEAAVKAAVEVGDLKPPTKALDMAGQKITTLPTPIAGGEPATKSFVEGLIQGLDWQNSVKDELADPPGTPAIGDRYIVIATATGDWEGHENDIAEWDGAAWDFFTPNMHWTVSIEDEGRQKTFNGTAWVFLASIIDHGNLLGLTDDDHPQYQTAGRADTWLAGKNVNSLADVTSPGADIEDAVTKKHPAPTYDPAEDEVVFQI